MATVRVSSNLGYERFDTVSRNSIGGFRHVGINRGAALIRERDAMGSQHLFPLPLSITRSIRYFLARMPELSQIETGTIVVIHSEERVTLPDTQEGAPGALLVFGERVRRADGSTGFVIRSGRAGVGALVAIRGVSHDG